MRKDKKKPTKKIPSGKDLRKKKIRRYDALVNLTMEQLEIVKSEVQIKLAKNREQLDSQLLERSHLLDNLKYCTDIMQKVEETRKGGKS